MDKSRSSSRRHKNSGGWDFDARATTVSVSVHAKGSVPNALKPNPAGAHTARSHSGRTRVRRALNDPAIHPRPRARYRGTAALRSTLNPSERNIMSLSLLRATPGALHRQLTGSSRRVTPASRRTIPASHVTPASTLADGLLGRSKLTDAPQPGGTGPGTTASRRNIRSGEASVMPPAWSRRHASCAGIGVPLPSATHAPAWSAR